MSLGCGNEQSTEHFHKKCDETLASYSSQRGRKKDMCFARHQKGSYWRLQNTKIIDFVWDSIFVHCIRFWPILWVFVLLNMGQIGTVRSGIVGLLCMLVGRQICSHRDLTKMCRLSSKLVTKLITAVVTVKPQPFKILKTCHLTLWWITQNCFFRRSFRR